MYTAPMSISQTDFKKIRSRLAEIIKEVTDVAINQRQKRWFILGSIFSGLKR